MKLLLVDDEEFTRHGIYNKIKWHDIGIEHICLADDGLNGFEAAKTFLPDIILTDVRMPRMDGVKMAYAIREILPDCSIIFMSGYSDKDYLKAAINLSALGYVDKPIDLSELTNEIKSAVNLHEQARQRLLVEIQMKEQLNISIPALKKQVAEELMRKQSDDTKTQTHLNIAFPDIPKGESYVSILFCIMSKTQVSTDISEQLLHTMCDGIIIQLEKEGIYAVTGMKEPCFVITHICMLTKSGRFLTKDEIRSILHHICQVLSHLSKIYAIVGTQVNGIMNTYLSYIDAEISLKNDFFYYQSEVMFCEGNSLNIKHSPKSPDSLHFSKMLDEGNMDGCLNFINKYISRLNKQKTDSVNTVKRFFLDVMTCLVRAANMKGIVLPEGMSDINIVKEQLFEFLTLSSICDYTVEAILQYFSLNEDKKDKNDVVGRIKTYIVKQHSDCNLSVSSIAHALNFSASYLCVIFKKETGRTLNQYITDYRMNRAKEYLCNTDIRIKTIASLIGYTDCNYFIKAFKKVEGVTPLYYREIKASLPDEDKTK